MEKWTIREAIKADNPSIYQVIEAAFRQEAISDHQEHFLVQRLQISDAFIPELSLVATTNPQIIGHILLTKIKIVHQDQYWVSLALAPLSVHPNFQKKGIGSQLTRMALHRAKNLGYTSVVVVGHADYYPKFGFRPISNFDIQLPFEVPPENSMALELIPNALKDISGTVEYPSAFFDTNQ